MGYHWQSANMKVAGVDDMTLLSKVSDDSIVENLKKRFMDDWIYTYIGPVLVSVNPFKNMPYFGEKEITSYQGAAPYEKPPHIYAIADSMYRNMLIDRENQCVIISGESGAGKTVAAKYIMNYVSRISGGGNVVQHVKDVILESNPLLEAFGNAKTLRNNNSSRFGKYVEILFGAGGEPIGGLISNFLLEKSRVVSINNYERSFHIFYQMCTADGPFKEQFAIGNVKNYAYLAQSSCHTVEGISDANQFEETLKAMDTVGLSAAEKNVIFQIASGVLHLGNVQMASDGNYAKFLNANALQYPAALFEVNPDYLGKKLVSRVMDGKWGRQADIIEVTLNLEQANHTRDALAKAIYARLFDYLVKRVNLEMHHNSYYNNLGILDIYGFEIFEFNGFEQFCINYVNEKLQQIFIELTLKAEQEEYLQEGIRWVPIEYFNNQVVCDLIEGKRPPGIFAILNDVCATMHAVTHTADTDFQKKLSKEVIKHQHYQLAAQGFSVHHYAGVVQYNVEGFCDRNRDVLSTDLIKLMQGSQNDFIRKLFPDETENNKSRPTTAGTKICKQANELVEKLMKCTPHYVRCIKPNESKRPRDWENERVRHQVEYLGLKENVRVRRAGFAYRRIFQKFLQRYSILSAETWPHWRGNLMDGVVLIMRSAHMDTSQYQIGKTKVFIKDPESIFQLEELRERKYDGYARTIQKAFRKYFAQRRRQKERQEACAIVFGKKQRRRHSLNRAFNGDYIGMEHRPDLSCMFQKREKIEFCESINKFDRTFKQMKRDFFITNQRVVLIGREKAKKGQYKGHVVPIVKRSISFRDVIKVSVSTRQDDIVAIHVKNSYDTLIESIFKTELLTVLNKRFIAETGQNLNLQFTDTIHFTVKKEGWRGGGTRTVKFQVGRSDMPEYCCKRSILYVSIANGLPSNTEPSSVPYFSNNASGNGSIPNKPPRMKADFEESYNLRNQIPEKNRQWKPAQYPMQQRFGGGEQNKIMSRNPPPPSGPAPADALRYTDLEQLTHAVQSARHDTKEHNDPKNLAHVFRLPNAGVSGDKRNSIHRKPQPGGGRPKPKPKSLVIIRPQCVALYDRDAAAADEISIREGDIIEIIREDPSGWWTGKLNGNEGLFPGNYVEKIDRTS